LAPPPSRLDAPVPEGFVIPTAIAGDDDFNRTWTFVGGNSETKHRKGGLTLIYMCHDTCQYM
jgi:hypothetical protein